MDTTRQYLQACFDRTAGWLIVAVGHDPHRDANGKYSHRRWSEHALRWPEQAEQAVAAIARQAPTADVYACPYLMRDRRRALGNSVSRVLAHADVDHQCDPAAVAELGGFAIASGTSGHAHVYVPLSYATTRAQHEMLCRALTTHLDGDTKYSDNDLLRPPGTLNHKTAVAGGDPCGVEWIVKYTARCDPRALAVTLGVDIAHAEELARNTRVPDCTIEPIDLDAYPVVRAALAERSGDRSSDTMRTTRVCFDAGLSLAQTRWAVRTRPDLAQRLDEFAARRQPVDDLQNCFNAIADDQPQSFVVAQPPPPVVEKTAANSQPAGGTDTTAEQPPAAPADPPPEDPPPAAPRLGLTDKANATVLAATYAPTIRYTPAISRWMHWTGVLWRTDPDTGPIDTAAGHIAAALPAKTDEQKAHRRRSLSVSGITGMVRLARSDPEMRLDRDRLDAHAYELNTPTGIVDLRTGAIRDHHPDAYHTRITGVGYDPQADCPEWKAFLHTTFGGDQDLIDYVQQLAGCATIGEVIHHVLVFCYGTGDNGKTVFLEVLSRVLGDYAIAAPPNFLLAGRDKHETEIARLAGARFVVCSEVNQRTRFDEAKVKLLTGGDKLSGRFLYSDFFTFKPSHTLFLMGNHQPAVRAGGHAFWRRLRLIPFTNTVPREKQKKLLHETLVEREGPAILGWMVTGAVAVAGGWLTEPTAVTAATREYAETEDYIQQFIDECTLPADHEHRELSGSVYHRYVEWCRDNGTHPKDSRGFGRELSARGLRTDRAHGRRYVWGIALPKLPGDDG